MKLTAEIIKAIKESNSREEIIKRFYTDKAGNINLSYLNLKGCNVYLSGIEAEYINNVSQKAKEIFNQNQQAEKYIANGYQRSNEIYNCSQKAKYISNKNQKLKK